jgi:DNA modification methylase
MSDPIRDEWRSEDGSVRLILGNCLDVLPTLSGIDAIVTDPPYGTGWVRGGKGVGEFEAKHEQPEWDVWDTRWLRVVPCKSWAVFCPVNRLREVPGVPCYYRKTNPRPGGPTREAVVVTPEPWSAERWEFPAYNGDCPFHPCQKPIGLMVWAIGLVDGQAVADPYMGSGTTGVACVRTGRRFVGIEIEPKYWEIAVRRVRAELERFPLFEQAAKPRQLELLDAGAVSVSVSVPDCP